MRILFPASHWASNIGNPFFTLGVDWAVRNAVPEAEIIPTAANPILAMKLSGRTKKMSFNYGAILGDVDAVMFAGPMFDINFREFYEPTFRAAKEAGIRIFLVTAGGIRYDADEIEHCRKVLEQYPPDLLWTRDNQTFEAYGDLALAAHNGICGAWFTPKYYPGYATPRLGPYITSVFDFRPEPAPPVLAEAIRGAGDLPGGAITNTSFVNRVKRVLDRGGPAEIDGHMVIRPCDRPANHRITVFTKPNTFAAFTPYGYFNLFRNTTVTVTDRLHAAVVTLAYGRPAHLFLRSKRGNLLAAAGINYAPGKRLTADATLLEMKRQAILKFLRKSLTPAP
jgi:hypothetical protein